MIRRVLESISEYERETDMQFRHALESRGWKSYDIPSWEPIDLSTVPENDKRGDVVIWKGPIERMQILYMRHKGYPQMAAINIEPREPGQGILQPGGESRPEESDRGSILLYAVTSRQLFRDIKRMQKKYGLKYLGKVDEGWIPDYEPEPEEWDIIIRELEGRGWTLETEDDPDEPTDRLFTAGTANHYQIWRKGWGRNTFKIKITEHTSVHSFGLASDSFLVEYTRGDGVWKKVGEITSFQDDWNDFNKFIDEIETRAVGYTGSLDDYEDEDGDYGEDYDADYDGDEEPVESEVVMNDRTKQLLESVGTAQSRRRRRDRGKQDAVDAVLESARGARPSDEMDSMQGVDVQVDDTDKDAPVAANIEMGPGALDGVDVADEPPEGNMNAAAEVGDAEIPELDFEEIKTAAEKAGLKVPEIEADTSHDAIQRGAKVELEHTNDPLIAAAIAAAHIAEFPDYYDALQKMEDELKSKGTDENPVGEPGEEEPAGEPDEDDYEEIDIGEFNSNGEGDEEEEEEDEEEE